MQRTLSIGLALFSMFFGASNIVFSVALGQYAQNQNIYGIVGLLITAVCVPFLGLVAMALFDGNYRAFFLRIGKIPGYALAGLILLIMGPLGLLPRSISLSYSTIKAHIDVLPLPIFSLVSCILIFLLTYRRKRVLDILGYLLTPILLISLCILFIKGFFVSPTPPIAEDSKLSIFFHGLQEGYNTMDLMGSFFFSSIAFLCLKRKWKECNFVPMILKASVFASLILAIVYLFLSYLAACNANFLESTPQDEMFFALAVQALGGHAPLIASTCIILACLTTGIALSTVFAQFIHQDLTKTKISYTTSLFLTLLATFVLSALNFQGIVQLLKFAIVACYPALIMLTGLNILYKLYEFKPVKTWVALTFLLTLLLQFY